MTKPAHDEKSADQDAAVSKHGNETLVRIIAGVGLAGVAAAFLMAGPLSFAVFSSLVAALIAWEWGLIVRAGEDHLLLTLHIIAVLLAGAVGFIGRFDLALMILGAMMLVILLLRFKAGHLGWSLLGVGYAGLPLLAFIYLRSSNLLGLHAILFLILIVAATDIGAYFTGRTLGGAKFAPRISPNKTWSGFFGGVGLAGLVAFGFTQVVFVPHVLPVVVTGAVLAAISQMGDLFESFIKRRFGVKDSSRIIPGHGGVMDRADGLVFAALAAAVLSVVRHSDTPGAGLLFW